MFIVVFSDTSLIQDSPQHRIIRIMGSVRGLHYDGQRPQRIIVEEPEIIPLGYWDWLKKSVCFCGCHDAKFIYAKHRGGITQ